MAPTHLTEVLPPKAFGAARLHRESLDGRWGDQWPSPVFGVSTARDMARFYATLVAGGEMDGVRILRAETVARAVVVDGQSDPTHGGPVRRCLGFKLSGLHEPAALTTGTDSNDRTFYQHGFGTLLAWGDLDLQLSMAFLTHGLRIGDTGARRERMLSDAVRAAAREAG